MKVACWIIAAAGLLGAADAAFAAKAPLPERIQVEWAPNDQLREVKDNRFERGWMRPEEWQQTLGDHLRRRADRVLPAGEHLSVHVDDVKLAGAFEPWHRPGLDDVRILKDIYPPMMDVHYTLTAADGTTIRQGAAKLRDNGYLQRAVADSSDPLRFDKRMIDEWLAREFGPKRGAG
jgi:hypothetical protein